MLKNLLFFPVFIAFFYNNTATCQVIITEDSDNDVNVVSHEAVDQFEDVKAILKVSPLHFARGKFVLFSQFRASPKVSIELGAGVSFVDYFNIYIYEETIILEDQAYTLGPHVEGSLTVHPGGDALLGYYGSFNLRYSRTNYTYQNYGNILIDDKPGNISDFSFNMIFGYQDTDWSDSFVYDVYGGFGFINRNQTVIDSDDGVIENKPGLIPVIRLGVKLGMILN
mgnify:CR=1 FL=1